MVFIFNILNNVVEGITWISFLNRVILDYDLFRVFDILNILHNPWWIPIEWPNFIRFLKKLPPVIRFWEIVYLPKRIEQDKHFRCIIIPYLSCNVVNFLIFHVQLTKFKIWNFFLIINHGYFVVFQFFKTREVIARVSIHKFKEKVFLKVTFHVFSLTIWKRGL